MAVTNFVKRIQDVMRNDAGVNGDAQRIEQLVWILFLKIYDEKEKEWETHQGDFRSVIPEELRWRNWAADHEDGQALCGESLLDFVNHKLFPALKNLKIDETAPINRAIVKYAFEDANNYMKDGFLLRQAVNIVDGIDFTEGEEQYTFGGIYEAFLRELQSAGNAGEFYTPRAVTDFMAAAADPYPGDRIADFACGTGGFLVSALEVLRTHAKEADECGEYGQEYVYGIEKKGLPYILCVTNMLLHNIENPMILRGNALETDYKKDEKIDQFDVILMNPPYGGREKDSVKENFPPGLRSADTADLFCNVIMSSLKREGRCGIILPDGFLFGTDHAKKNIKKKMLDEFNLHTVIRLPHSVFAPYTSIATNILFFDKTHPTKEIWFYRMDMPEGYKSFSKTKPVKAEHFASVLAWWEKRQEISVNGCDKAKKYDVEELVQRNYNLDLCGYPREEDEILPPKELIQQYQCQRGELNAQMDEILAQITALLEDGAAEEKQ